jgi:signal transduction histidine kinase
LLLAGLAAAALVAHRVTGPLRRLAQGVEALAQGELGTQVRASTRGEIGELETAFNRMSARLAQLEAEKLAWRAREHLAELGDVARGLAHTLRNPLHTLGLVVEELASRGGAADGELVATARGQIRRIDRWMRSFLSIGAGPQAAPQVVDLGDLVRDVALEAVQQGARLELDCPPEPLPAPVVVPALRSALSNLLGNALEASPADGQVTIGLERVGAEARLRVADRGSGLPPEVRRRLYSPHVTTKASGSGMGLFLTKQLIEGLHGGRLEIADRPGGGTEARICLPLASAQAAGSRPGPGGAAPVHAAGQPAAGDGA